MPTDLEAVRNLWLDYLTWGTTSSRQGTAFGFRPRAVEHDLATIAKFQPPDGRLLIAFEGDVPVGTACMRRIGPDTCEIKRMWVDPSYRRGGLGRAMLDRLIGSAQAAGYGRMRLDSPDFMTPAHGLYRSNGFVEIEPYRESEIPDEYRAHWLFMEGKLA